MLEKIESQGKTFALILRHELEVEGVKFFTASDNPLQLGVIQHEKGTEIKAHVHRNATREIGSIQEVLHIEYGRVEVNFYNMNGEEINAAVLNTGDTILLLDGGHGFKILEDTRILEIKQGPYHGIEDDKIILE